MRNKFRDGRGRNAEIIARRRKNWPYKVVEVGRSAGLCVVTLESGSQFD